MFGLTIGNLRSLVANKGYTGVTCEPAVTSGDLAGVRTIRVSAQTTRDLSEGLLGAPCGWEPHSVVAALPWELPGMGLAPVFSAKGTVLKLP